MNTLVEFLDIGHNVLDHKSYPTFYGPVKWHFFARFCSKVLQNKIDLLPIYSKLNLSGTSESSLVMVESDHQVVEVSVGKQRRHKEEKRDHKDGKEERRRGKKKQRKLVEEHLEEEDEGLTYLTRRQPHTERQGKS